MTPLINHLIEGLATTARRRLGSEPAEPSVQPTRSPRQGRQPNVTPTPGDICLIKLTVYLRLFL